MIQTQPPRYLIAGAAAATPSANNLILSYTPFVDCCGRTQRLVFILI
jgi:hypothetical protein